MTTVSIKYFDTHEFVKKSKELGSSEALAEYQIKQFEQAIETAVISVKDEIKSKELATKHDVDMVRKDVEMVRKDLDLLKLDLQKEIISSRNQMILWIAGLVIASGMIQHFFKYKFTS